MAKRPSPSAGRSAGGAQTARRSERRRPPTPVKRSFPWGLVAGSSVLALALTGILVYAVTNQGAGFVSPLKRADDSVRDVKTFELPEAKHVQGSVDYKQTPPVGGSHNGTPQTCQVYTEPVANEHVIHSLEHGAVWITYRPGLPAAELTQITDRARANQYRLVSPFPGLSTKVSLQAWGRQLKVNDVSDKRIDAFLDAYTSGPQAPEQGAACSGRSEPGPLQPVGGAAPAAGSPSSS